MTKVIQCLASGYLLLICSEHMHLTSCPLHLEPIAKHVARPAPANRPVEPNRLLQSVDRCSGIFRLFLAASGRSDICILRAAGL